LLCCPLQMTLEDMGNAAKEAGVVRKTVEVDGAARRGNSCDDTSPRAWHIEEVRAGPRTLDLELLGQGSSARQGAAAEGELPLVLVALEGEGRAGARLVRSRAREAPALPRRASVADAGGEGV